MQGLVINDFSSDVSCLLDFFQELVLASDLQMDEPVFILVAVKSAAEMGLVLLLHLAKIG